MFLGVPDPHPDPFATSTDPDPDPARKEVIFFYNFLSTLKIKNFKKSFYTLSNDLKSSPEIFFFCQNSKKNS
jgi:hypothetical protein